MTKQVLFFILITLCILTSCGDNIDIRQGETPKFVIYAFPSASDTIPITNDRCHVPNQRQGR